MKRTRSSGVWVNKAFFDISPAERKLNTAAANGRLAHIESPEGRRGRAGLDSVTARKAKTARTKSLQAFNPSFGQAAGEQTPDSSVADGPAFTRDSAEGLVPLLETENGMCKWPFTVEGVQLFCAAPRLKGKRYCQACYDQDRGRARAKADF